jgi:hypothetical protein
LDSERFLVRVEFEVVAHGRAGWLDTLPTAKRLDAYGNARDKRNCLVSLVLAGAHEIPNVMRRLIEVRVEM